MNDISRNVTANIAHFPTRSAGPVCLNFKVPLRVRQQLKMYAVQHKMTMTELLLKMCDAYLTPEANWQLNKETKK